MALKIFNKDTNRWEPLIMVNNKTPYESIKESGALDDSITEEQFNSRLGDLVNNTDACVSIMWDKLKMLRDTSKLCPGTFYRITDYECTTVQADSRSANHPFDIIVQALDEKTLSENASAIQREGDEYFANSNLNAWKLKYAIDNDTSRFAWAKEEIKEQPAKWEGSWGVLEERYDDEVSTNYTEATIDEKQKYLYRPTQPTSYLQGKTFYRYDGREIIELSDSSELYFVTRENPFEAGGQTEPLLVIYAPTGRIIRELEVTTDNGKTTDYDDITIWNTYFGDELGMKTYGNTIDINGEVYFTWEQYDDDTLVLDDWAYNNSPFILSEGTKIVYNGSTDGLYYALDSIVGKYDREVYEVTDGNHIYKYENEGDGEDALLDTISYAPYIAPREEGKGVIYRMIDEHNNDCPFDFKNMQFNNNNNWYYTFSQNGRDLSLTDYCADNFILQHTDQGFTDGTTAVKTIIPMVVFDMKSNSSGKFAGILHNKMQVPITKGYLAGTKIVANEWCNIAGGSSTIASDISIVSSGNIFGNRIYGPCTRFEVGTTTPISNFYANNITLPTTQDGLFKCLCSVFNNNTLNLSEGKRGFTITSGSLISCEIENSNCVTVGFESSDDISLGANVVLRNSRIRIFNDLTINYANTTSSTSPLRFLDIDARGLEATTITIPTSFPANANYELKVAKNSQGVIKMWCDADLIQ